MGFQGGWAWHVGMGYASNRVEVMEGNVTAFMRQTNALESVCGNIHEQLHELTNIMKALVPTNSLIVSSGQIVPLQKNQVDGVALGG